MNAAGWLLAQSDVEHTPETLVAGLAAQLARDGLPILRSSAWLPTEHPELWGSQIFWRRGTGAQRVPRPHDVHDTPTFQGSPAQELLAGRGTIRCRLDGPRDQLPYPVLAEIADEGAVDWVILPVDIANLPGASWLSLATDRATGFSDAELVELEALRPILSLHFQVLIERIAKRSLLEVYLGPNAAQHVMSGQFHRGTGTVVRAAIWFCDLRGFTNLGDRLGPRDVVSILDAYFECVADPIEANGGEILKLIGDAALAIFPVGADGPSDPCRRARAAAEAAIANLDQLRETHAEWPPLAMGVALHLGDVFYGNIGGKSRLDFTVIGSAVNEAARVESMCKILATPLLMTGAFAEALGADDTVTLGAHTLKGVSSQAELRTLRRFIPT